jgi:hypothetical protein
MSVTLSQVPLRRSPLAVKNFFNSLNPVKQIALDGKARTVERLASSNGPSGNANDQVWFRVSQLADKHKQFTENAIRAQIFAAKPRLSAKTKNGNSWIDGNGLSPAIRKRGRTVLINEPMYAMWLATGSCGEGCTK